MKKLINDIKAILVVAMLLVVFCVVGLYTENDYAKGTVVSTSPFEVVVRLEDGNEYSFLATETTLEEGEEVTVVFNNAGEITGVN